LHIEPSFHRRVHGSPYALSLDPEPIHG
jgi:hypothetical protein